MTASTPARWILIATIAWSAFAFGAVYPWAYWPLTVAVLLVALASLLAPVPRGWQRLGLAPLALALLLFLLAGVAQVVPLPYAVVQRVSPDAPSLIEQYDPAAALNRPARHALSIVPSHSIAGLCVIASLALLVIGVTRLLSITGAVGIARAITVIGVLLALVGIVQQPLYAGKIYGFWRPLDGGNPYGPFVNKNHFAGWMLMGLPLTIGLLFRGISRGLRGVRPGAREKILWLASPDASSLLLLSAAACLMGLSLVLSMSRSGMSAAALAIVCAAALAVRRYRSKGQRIAALALAGALPLLAVCWAGTDIIAKRFSSASMQDLNGRLGPWNDAIRIAARYPLAGTGLNTYGIATLFYQQFNRSVYYGQAHNDYLQLAAEGGVLLTVPAIICVGLLVVGIRRRFREDTSASTYWIRAGATIGLIAIGFQEMVEFSLQMPGNALLFAVLCAIALHRAPDRGAQGLAHP